MEYKDFAIDLAKRAGETIRQNFTLNMKKEWKEDNSPVTETDTAINKMVIEAVAKEFPDHDVKAEEESNIVNNSEYLWVCDPIDGTIPFSHGIPMGNFSLALVKNGESILGVLYDPFLDRLFYAQKDAGSTLNGIPIKVNNDEQGYIDLETTKIPEIIKPLKDHKFQINKYACGTYGGFLVACGELVGMISQVKYAHDIAALKIIVEEAGGKVTDIFGNEQRYDGSINGAIVSNGKIHDLLVGEIGKVIKAF